MNSVKQEIIFSKEEVKRFVGMLGMDQRGGEKIPLPPTMPMITYQWIKLPWELKEPLIHRKQKSTLHKQMFSDTPYYGIVVLSDQFERRNLTFIKQRLQLFDNVGNLIFEGISEIICGGVS